MEKETLCQIAKPFVDEIPNACHAQLSWANLPNDVKTKLNPRKASLKVYLPPRSFDILFSSEKGSIYDYSILVETVEELQSVFDEESKNALQFLLPESKNVFEAFLLAKNGQEVDEKLMEKQEKILSSIKMITGAEKPSEIQLTANTLVERFSTDLFVYLTSDFATYSTDQPKIFFNKKKKADSKFEATRSMLTSEVGRLLHCHDCRQALAEMRTLPCLHTYCSTCIKKAHDGGGAKKPATITCPRCQTTFSSEPDIENKLDLFPANPVMEAFLELKSLCKKPLQCSQCMSDPTTLCVHCKKLFCKFHSVKYFHGSEDGHVFVELEDIVLQPGKLQHTIFQLCAYHKKSFAKFCNTCQISFCADEECTAQHNAHDVQNSSDMAAERKSSLVTLDALLRQKTAKLGEKIHDAEQGQRLISEMQSNIEDSIRQYFDDMTAILDQKKQQMLEQIAVCTDESLQQLENNRERLKMWISAAQRLETEYQSTIHGGSSSSPNLNQLRAAKIAYIKQLTDCAGGASLSQPKIISYPEGQLRSLLQSISSLRVDFETFNRDHGWEIVVKCAGIQSFCVENDKIYFIKNTVVSSQIMVHDMSTKDSASVSNLSDATMSGLSSLATAGYGKIVATQNSQSVLDLKTMGVRKTGMLKFYNSKTGELTGSYVIPPAPPKVASNQFWVKPADGKMYICDGTTVAEGVIEEDQLKVIRRFNFNGMVDIGDFQPYPTNSNTLFVTDKSRHKLLIFNNEQQVVETIGEEGALAKSFLTPLAVTADHFGHIMVADAGNRRIQFFDQSGTFIRLMGYPPSFKDEALAFKDAYRVTLLAEKSYLYLHDSRADAVFRVKYL